MVSIIIADDHRLIREGLKKYLSADKRFRVVAEAQNSSEVYDVLEKFEADVLLLDVNMPGRSGLDILSHIKSLYPKLNILVVSMHPEESIGVRALQYGASGYIAKHASQEELLEAVSKVAEGKKYIGEKLAEKLAEQIANPTLHKKPHELLSEREFEVFCKLAGGKTVSEIANELSLGTPTVSTYRARILEKMGMKSTVELIHYAVKNNLA